MAITNTEMLGVAYVINLLESAGYGMDALHEVTMEGTSVYMDMTTYKDYSPQDDTVVDQDRVLLDARTIINQATNAGFPIIKCQDPDGTKKRTLVRLTLEITAGKLAQIV